jgi:hypothetical protein
LWRETSKSSTAILRPIGKNDKGYHSKKGKPFGQQFFGGAIDCGSPAPKTGKIGPFVIIKILHGTPD